MRTRVDAVFAPWSNRVEPMRVRVDVITTVRRGVRVHHAALAVDDANPCAPIRVSVLAMAGAPDWLISRRRLRADAERLLRACGVQAHGPGDEPYADAVRETMRGMWLAMTGEPVATVVYDRFGWSALSRTEREVLRAQWRDGLEVLVEDIDGDPTSRRPALSWSTPRA